VTVLPYTGYLARMCPFPVLYGPDGAPMFAHWRRPRQVVPREIVLHYTAGKTVAFDRIAWWLMRANPSQVSAHFLVDRDGSYIMMVPPTMVANHAGNRARNYGSIGIENVSMDGTYTEPQMTTLIHLCAQLCALFRIDPWTGIVGHRDIVTTLCPRGLDVREVAGCVAVEMAI